MDLWRSHDLVTLQLHFYGNYGNSHDSLEVHHSLQSAPDWLRPVLLRAMMAPAQLG